jgi:hypothetical protein
MSAWPVPWPAGQERSGQPCHEAGQESAQLTAEHGEAFQGAIRTYNATLLFVRVAA